MTAEQLNYLLVLEEEQNLSRAAARLYITQPTLTAYINRLEKSLGVPLFDRHHSPVKPTVYGRRYIEKMKEIVYAEVQLNDSIRNAHQNRRQITIGIGYAHSEIMTPDLVVELVSRHPDIDISIHEGQEKNLLGMLSRGELDIFLGHTELENLHTYHDILWEESSVLLVPAAFLAGTEYEGLRSSGKKPICLDPAILRDKTAILPSSYQGSYLSIMSALSPSKIIPPHTIVTRNLVAGARMASKGLGYSYGNHKLVSLLRPAEQKKLVYCTLPYMKPTRNFYFSYSKDNPNKDLLDEVVAILREQE